MKIKMSFIVVSIIFIAVFIFHSSSAKADIHVYDNNNQYLGILLDSDDSSASIYIPSLEASWIYHLSSSCGDEAVAYYENGTCTGQAYARRPFSHVLDFTDFASLGGYYIPNYSGRTNITPGSYIETNCECWQTSSLPEAEYYPLEPVQLPFTTPVALPLRYEVRNKAVVIPLN